MMRKLYWTIMLVGGYVWVVTSGNEDLVLKLALDRGKAIYKATVAWFDDAPIDFHVKQEKEQKKRSRRWD